MNWELITDVLIWVVAAFLIIYDVAVIFYHGANASISVRVVNMSKQYLIIPVIIGVLIGHFFFPLYAGCN